MYFIKGLRVYERGYYSQVVLCLYLCIKGSVREGVRGGGGGHEGATDGAIVAPPDLRRSHSKLAYRTGPESACVAIKTQGALHAAGVHGANGLGLQALQRHDEMCRQSQPLCNAMMKCPDSLRFSAMPR